MVLFVSTRKSSALAIVGGSALILAALTGGGCQQPSGETTSTTPSTSTTMRSTPRPAPDDLDSAPDSFSSSTTTTYSPANLTVSPDGRWLACAQIHGETQPVSLLMFDAKSGKQLDAMPLAPDASAELSWLSPNRLSSYNGSAQVWKVSPAGKLSRVTTYDHPAHLPSVKSASGRSKLPPTYMVQFTTVSSAHQLGARLLTRTIHEGDRNTKQLIEIFDPKTERGARFIEPPDYSPDDSLTLRFAPAGEPRLLVGEYTSKFSLWEPRAGRRLWQQSVEGLAPELNFTPDGHFLIATQVTGSHGRDMYPLHETLVFDAKTGKRVRSLPTQSTVYAEALAGDTLATYATELRADKKNQRWTSLQFTNWKTGKVVSHLWLYPGGSMAVNELGYSPQAGTVWINKDGLVKWNIADLRRGKLDRRPVYPPLGMQTAEEF